VCPRSSAAPTGSSIFSSRASACTPRRSGRAWPGGPADARVDRRRGRRHRRRRVLLPQEQARGDGVAERFAGLHRLLLNKYYVDEVYDATIVQPIRIASEEGLWKFFDVRVIDGAVNGVAQTVAAAASCCRRAQSGSVRTYAASLLLGVVAILGYYLWP
jgi:hypothetical protein